MGTRSLASAGVLVRPYPLFEAAQLNLAREELLVGLLLDRLLAAPPHSVAPAAAHRAPPPPSA